MESDDLLTKVRGNYPGVPKVVNLPKSNESCLTYTVGILAETKKGRDIGLFPRG